MEARNKQERKTLLTVLTINTLMFFIEFGFGFLAQSTGLIADSLDMFADASVYAVSLYAIGRSVSLKTKAAFLSGIMQIALALTALADVVRRFIWGSEPLSSFIIGIGLLALIANVTCLLLISKHRQGDVNMRASWIFSKNDVIANLSVIVSGGIVALTGSRYPDLVIGFMIAVLVSRGGFQILREAQTLSVVNNERKQRT
jgi:cation diffusion facilitator family transporter